MSDYKYDYVYLTEKDSQVKALTEVLGAKYGGKWKPAYNDKDKIALVPLMGHVLVGLEPKEYNPKYGVYGESSIYVFPEEYKLKPSTTAGHILNTAVEHLKQAKNIVIATDYDNEGATIAMNVIRYAKAENRVQRMLPMGSTHPDELRKAIDNPIDIPYLQMADAGSTRSFIDWAEGMSLSRALSYYLGNSGKTKLNFGGVKTPLIYMVVERDLSNSSHKKSYYWTVFANLDYNGSNIPVKLQKKKTIEDKNGKEKLVYEDRFDTEIEAKEAIDSINGQNLKIKRVTRKRSRTVPPKLFELAGLQAEMSKNHNVKPSGTMDLAQTLYDYPISLQTYPRTDIPYLKESEYIDVKPILQKLKNSNIIKADIIEDILNKEIPKRTTTFNDKEVVAHGAIIPTLKGDINKYYNTFGSNEKRVFSYISKRYVANFMEDYEYESISGETEEVNNELKFVFTESVPLKAGWKYIYDEDIKDKISKYQRVVPENIKMGEEVKVSNISNKKNETKPKPLFTMTTLLQGMEKVANLFPEDKEIKDFLGKHGIGTNATRAGIIDHIMSEKYNKGEPWLIEKNGKIISTKKAQDFIKVMPKDLVSPIKRAILSKKLSLVEKGEIKANDLVNEYRDIVKGNIDLIKDIYNKHGAVASNVVSLGKCPKCGKDIIEENKLFKCSTAKSEKNENGEWINTGCDYKIFKTALKRFGKNSVTATEVKNVLNKGRATVNLKSKANKPYKASIVVDNKWGIQVKFDSPKS